MHAETPDSLQTIYEFDEFQYVLWDHAQAINNGNYGKDHGIAYIGNNGTLVLDRGGWKVITEGKNMETVEEVKKTDDGLANHTRNFIDAVKSGNYSQLAAPIQAGATVANVCQMGNIAYKTGRKLNWDKKTGTFNDAAANKLIQPVIITTIINYQKSKPYAHYFSCFIYSCYFFWPGSGDRPHKRGS